MSNAKVIIVILRIGLIKKILLYKMSYSPGPYNPSSKHEIKVGLNLIIQQNLTKQQKLMHQIWLKRLI